MVNRCDGYCSNDTFREALKIPEVVELESRGRRKADMRTVEDSVDPRLRDFVDVFSFNSRDELRFLVKLKI